MKKLLGMFLAALMTAALLLAGCGDSSSDPVPDPEHGIYLIYRLNSDGVTLVKETIEVEADEPEDIARELLNDLMEVPPESRYQSIFPSDVKLLGSSFADGVCTVDFSTEYRTMDKNREVVCRAGLARTITQIDGIDYVKITCGGQALQDSSGNPVGAFSGSDFVDSIANINSYEHATLTLYFADPTGQKLVPETRDAVHNISTSTERLVVEQLIAGSQENLGAVLPKDTRILNVSSQDGICYVNLDSSFLTAELPATDSLALYAIVDSLTELKSVSLVQLMADGSADVSFRSYSLSKPFERDESWINKE